MKQAPQEFLEAAQSMVVELAPHLRLVRNLEEQGAVITDCTEKSYEVYHPGMHARYNIAFVEGQIRGLKFRDLKISFSDRAKQVVLSPVANIFALLAKGLQKLATGKTLVPCWWDRDDEESTMTIIVKLERRKYLYVSIDWIPEEETFPAHDLGHELRRVEGNGTQETVVTRLFPESSWQDDEPDFVDTISKACILR